MVVTLLSMPYSLQTTLQACRGNVRNAELVGSENDQLQPFLGQRNVLMTALKAAVDRVAGHEDVLAAMAQLSVECIEQARQ